MDLLKMKLHLIENKPFEIDGIEFIPIRCYHHKLPVYGYRVGDLTYITDTNYIPDEELEKIKGSKILIINALRKEKHISHFNLNIHPNDAYAFTRSEFINKRNEGKEGEIFDKIIEKYKC